MIEKLIQVRELYAEAMINDRLVAKFFDVDSQKQLDLKIKVLNQLKNGVPPKDIPEYHSILELYPADGADWD